MLDENELKARLEVAMAYRLIDRHALSELSDGFVAARIASTNDAIFGGYGLFPELARASDLHRCPIDAPVEVVKFGGIDFDARNFAKTVFEARPEMTACIHAHPFYTMAFSCLDSELLPISQYAFMFHDLIGYIPFLDAQVTGDHQCQMIGDLLASGKELVILRNHGVIVPGRTVRQAFWTLLRIETTCRIQLEVIRTGAPLSTPPAELLPAIRHEYWNDGFVDNDGEREWPSFVRLLDKADPSWRD